jgi:hypothetical protein
MKLSRYVYALLAATLLTIAPQAHGLDILLCNDDGFTSANTRALYQQLIHAGHRVVISAPVDNQSGRGGYISFLAPIPKIPATYTDPYTGGTVITRAVLPPAYLDALQIFPSAFVHKQTHVSMIRGRKL